MVHLTENDSDEGAIDVKPSDGNTRFDHLCQLNAFAQMPHVRLTGIICTIGPSSRSVEMLEKMMATGMNIARLNFSHGTHEYHAGTVTNIRQAVKNYSEKLGYEFPVAIALDTKGPEIRTGLIKGSSVAEIELKKGDNIKVTTNIEYKEKCSNDILWLDYENIINVVKRDDRIFIDDGLISLVVRGIEGDTLSCVVEVGGVLGSSKGVNLPGTPVDLPSVSKKDKSDFIFGIEQNVDMIFASFIRNAAALKEIRDILGEKGKNIKIVSKIENQQGMDNIDEIIPVSDGVMVARGDLGIEIPIEKVFIAQKLLIAKCNRVGVPIICATQMLENMIKNPFATQAELSDVANAVLDGSDCVMLSGETAKGSYPTEVILTMANSCKFAESATLYKHFLDDLINDTDPSSFDSATSVALSAVETASKSKAKVIVVITASGKTAHLTSRFRPKCPIIAVTRNPQVARQFHLYRGIIPLIFPDPPVAECYKDVDVRVQYGLKFAKENKLALLGDSVVILTVVKHGSKYTNTLRVLSVE